MQGVTGQNWTDKGATGSTAPQGVQGVTGQTGRQGATGSTGPERRYWYAGRDRHNLPSGSNWQYRTRQGVQGVTGQPAHKSNWQYTNPQGATGMQGVTGTTGLREQPANFATRCTRRNWSNWPDKEQLAVHDPQGATGMQGVTGTTGQGATGNTKRQGVQGVTGQTCLKENWQHN